MSVEVTDYINVAEKAKNLGLEVPEKLSLLPRNFQEALKKEDLIQESSAATVRKLFAKTDLPFTPIEKSGERIPSIQENDITWIGPTIFISALFLSSEPNAVAIALNVIANYLTDILKGSSDNCKLDIVVGNKRIRYKGNAEGMKEISKIAKEIVND